MNEERKKRLTPRVKMRMIQAALLVAAVVVVFAAGAVWSRTGSATTVTSDLISQRIRAVSEFATVEYHYTNMGKFENQVDFYGWKVPLTRKRFIVSYDGVIKAGIDAEHVAVKVHGKTVTVTLPAAQVLSHEIDDGSLQIFDETTNIFNPLKISDYTGFAADQKSAVESKAIENGLLTEAADKARDAVLRLLGLAPGMEAYQIEVNIAN